MPCFLFPVRDPSTRYSKLLTETIQFQLTLYKKVCDRTPGHVKSLENLEKRIDALAKTKRAFDNLHCSRNIRREAAYSRLEKELLDFTLFLLADIRARAAAAKNNKNKKLFTVVHQVHVAEAKYRRVILSTASPYTRPNARGSQDNTAFSTTPRTASENLPSIHRDPAGRSSSESSMPRFAA